MIFDIEKNVALDVSISVKMIAANIEVHHGPLTDDETREILSDQDCITILFSKQNTANKIKEIFLRRKTLA